MLFYQFWCKFTVQTVILIFKIKKEASITLVDDQKQLVLFNQTQPNEMYTLIIN